MSSWTEIILTASILEDVSEEDSPSHFPAIDHINDQLSPFSLFEIKAPRDDQHCPHACFAGHVKSLDRQGLIEAIRATHWEWAEQVQLFLRGEDERGFIEIIPLFLHA